MSTLILTCIYNNLYGSEFGGRNSRVHHYRYSLLNIINLKPTKIICFTSIEELQDLENFFYIENNIDPKILEFKIFDLKNTKYFDLIYRLKDIEAQKKSDRCFEIQYNKFFWIDDIDNISLYDNTYWFDAGLSHGGLFPNEYMYDSYNNDHNRKWYNVELFTEKYLEYLNKLVQDNKILLVSKNNLISASEINIPNRYYINFDNSRHIVGGFFGGNTIKYKELAYKFSDLLLELLNNENRLYMEEHIMSCLYANEKNIYHTLEFDDWMPWPDHVNKPPMKYFYKIFLQ